MPQLDDKVLADWNGLAIAALARAGIVLEQPQWLDQAKAACRFITDSMLRKDHADVLRLSQSWRQGVSILQAFASDYVEMTRAALVLHECATPSSGIGSTEFLALAEGLTMTLLDHYSAKSTGLLHMAADDADDIVHRLAPTSDDAAPNAHGHHLDNLVRLAAVSGDQAWRHKADQMIAALTPRILESPFSHCSILGGLAFLLQAAEIRVCGRDREKLHRAALLQPFMNRIVVDQGAGREDCDDNATGDAGKATAVICVGQRCLMPITEPADMATRLREAQTVA